MLDLHSNTLFQKVKDDLLNNSYAHAYLSRRSTGGLDRRHWIQHGCCSRVRWLCQPFFEEMDFE